ncbi:MAG: hypothetical protein ACYCPF_08320 [Streptosporangiaceae bacterium]
MPGTRDLLRVAGVACVVAVAAAGCTTTGAKTGAKPPAPRLTGVAAAMPVRTRSRSAGVLGPPGGSSALARKLDRLMLGRLVLPTGAKPTGRRALQAADEIGSTNAVVVTRYYWVPASELTANAFFLAHQPTGMAQNGYGTGSGPSPQDFVQSVTYALRTVPAGIGSQDQLLVTLRADPHGGTIIRADATAIWYPWRTAAEYLRPSAYRSVTVTVTFPNTTSPNKSITRRRTSTSRAVIARLAAVLNGLHAAAGFMSSCPAFLPQYRLTFTPAAGGHPVVVAPVGCTGDQVTVAGRKQPVLSDVSSMKLFPVLARLLGVRKSYW